MSKIALIILFLVESENATTQQSAKNVQSREISVRNVNLTQVYCYTCRIYRPPRSSHCSICDNCIGKHYLPSFRFYISSVDRDNNYSIILLVSMAMNLG